MKLLNWRWIQWTNYIWFVITLFQIQQHKITEKRTILMKNHNCIGNYIRKYLDGSYPSCSFGCIVGGTRTCFFNSLQNNWEIRNKDLQNISSSAFLLDLFSWNIHYLPNDRCTGCSLSDWHILSPITPKYIQWPIWSYLLLRFTQIVLKFKTQVLYISFKFQNKYCEYS